MKASSALVVALLVSTPFAFATDLAVQKLMGRWAGNPANYYFGGGGGRGMIACNEKWIVAGSVVASEQASSQGAVQVFNAATGAWVRKLLPPPPAAANLLFGYSCALLGNKLVVGQQGALNGVPGAAHVFDLVTGKLLFTLKAPLLDDLSNNRFGGCVAITNQRILIGAAGVDSLRGAVYVFDTKTGAFIAKLQPQGLALAFEGNVLVTGAPGVDSNRGAVFMYDLTTLDYINKLQPAASAAGDFAGGAVAMQQGKVAIAATSANFGEGRVFIVQLADGAERTLKGSDITGLAGLGVGLAMDQGLLVAGAPFANSFEGALYAFDLNSSSNTELQTIRPRDLQTNFGRTIALSNGTLAISAENDGTQAANAGAVFVMRPLMKPLPFTKMTAKGDSAPGAPEIVFNTIGDAFINSKGRIAFVSTLTGAGSNAGKDTGVFSTMMNEPYIDLGLKSRDTVGPVSAGVVSKVLFNRDNWALFRSTFTGTGVTTANNEAICVDDGSSVMALVRKGWPLGAGGSPLFASFGQVVANASADRAVMTFTLQPGINGANATNDTGVLVRNSTFATDSVREGTSAAGTAELHGQFAPRVASPFQGVACVSALTGPAATNQALYQMQFQGARTLLARKGTAAPGVTGALFSAFLGESCDVFGATLARASLSGASSTTNEGLWVFANNGATKFLAMRKGDFVPGLTNVRIAKFIRYWQVTGQVMALVQLSGTGVTAANDQALLLYQTGSPFGGQLIVLLREGDPAPGCEPATIGVITRVEIEPSFGQYLIIATLAGAAPGTDLTMFRGHSFKSAISVAEQTLRRPFLVLRKGTWFTNQPGKLKSFALPATNVTAEGAGNTGLGSAIQTGTISSLTNVVLSVDFDNGVHEVMHGVP